MCTHCDMLARDVALFPVFEGLHAGAVWEKPKEKEPLTVDVSKPLDVFNDDEVPADTSTTVELTLGGSYEGRLETVGDRDWIRIELAASADGEAYEFSLTGSGVPPLSDPLLRLYDASGTLVATNDDGGEGLNSLLRFIADAPGTYYLEAAAWDDSVAGGYTLSATTGAFLPASNDDIADFLINGYWESTNRSARAWDVSDDGTITVDITGLTADGANLARIALDLWSEITGIMFTEVLTGADITFDDEAEGAFASTSTIGDQIVSVDVNVSTDWLDTYGTGLYSYSLQTYIHEVGHALGLGHSGPYNTSADFPGDAAYPNDSWQASIMSYFSQTQNNFINATFALVVTPQLADILAIQQLYGAPTDLRAGDTVYGFGSTADNIIYEATTFAGGPFPSFTIFDSDGVDTLDYSGFSVNQLINLNAGSISNIGNEVGNVQIALNTIIENAVLGGGNDTLIGNAVANVLVGGAGNDTLTGGLGGDVFSYRAVGHLAGVDTITDFADGDVIDFNEIVTSGLGLSFVGDAAFSGAGGEVRFGSNSQGATIEVDTNGNGLANLTIQLGASVGGVQLVSGETFQLQISGAVLPQPVFNEIEGTSAGEDINGTVDNDRINGLDGDDTLRGFGGDDELNGGSGADGLIGGDGDDVLNGGTGRDRLRGDDGDDELNGGAGG
ncbi:MAG: M10 family metallopeptidase, partial [Pseudomonadota bacterium]